MILSWTADDYASFRSPADSYHPRIPPPPSRRLTRPALPMKTSPEIALGRHRPRAAEKDDATRVRRVRSRVAPRMDARVAGLKRFCRLVETRRIRVARVRQPADCDVRRVAARHSLTFPRLSGRRRSFGASRDSKTFRDIQKPLGIGIARILKIPRCVRARARAGRGGTPG